MTGIRFSRRHAMLLTHNGALRDSPNNSCERHESFGKFFWRKRFVNLMPQFSAVRRVRVEPAPRPSNLLHCKERL